MRIKLISGSKPKGGAAAKFVLKERSCLVNAVLSIARPVVKTAGPDHPAPAKAKFKSVPETHKVLSETKYRRVISDLESVLLDISTDGVGINTPDGNISPSTLSSWAEQLRDALETLSKAQ
jgi:hypothetical protein